MNEKSGEAAEVATVCGFAVRGYEAVRREFERNFAERGELGAAFAVVRDGDLVVDLWGGVADRSDGRAWSEDTLQLVFSGTKGFVAVCLLLLLDRGELELEAPVCRYWPEFAEAGKAHVTVRDLATHTARLPGIGAPITVADVPDDRLMARLLAAQPQFDDPRAGSCYHALTYGWLCGELLRRIDGRSVGRFFAEEVAEPLGLEIYIGLPEELERRVSRLELVETWGSNPALEAQVSVEDELMRAVWGNPVLFAHESFPWNSRAYHAAQIPAVNGIGTARSIATLYAKLDTLVSAEALRLARSELERRREPLLGIPQAWGVGFELGTERREFGPAPDGFGCGGAGGSVHGAWPSERVSFSYAMNLMRDDADGDPRAQALLDALHACVING